MTDPLLARQGAAVTERVLSERDVLARLEAAIVSFGTVRAFCDAYEISPQYITDVRKGRRPPAARLCDCLGVRREVVYRDRLARAAAKEPT